MMVAVLFVGVLALTPKVTLAQQAIVSASDIQSATTVKEGSSGVSALVWQKFLNGYSTANLVADGKFGALSAAAAKVWQASKGLSADGVLGAMSRAAAITQINGNVLPPVTGTFPAGCTSAVGYSTTTGLPCTTTGGTFPAGCTSATGYSSTTGLSCLSLIHI